jgi:phage baseplate assembly protein W
MSAPIQTQVTPYKDFNINFTPHPITGDLLLIKGVQSVVQSVVNLIMTNHYDRPFHPEIGGNVQRLLFELSDPTTASLLSDEITNVILNFEKRAQIISVNVISDPDNNGYNVTITFSVVSNATPITISFFLERLR